MSGGAKVAAGFRNQLHLGTSLPMKEGAKLSAKMLNLREGSQGERFGLDFFRAENYPKPANKSKGGACHKEVNGAPENRIVS